MCYTTRMTKSSHAQSLNERTEKAGNFVREWISSNVYNVPGLADLPREIERLASQITSDAREEGISGGDLARAVGDIDDYLTGAYEKVMPVTVDAGTV
ncbi:MAG: hypothetical protein JWP16_1841 [Alphaproteobacteria bacterium]|nr:hypothetical protein [Alphaproteobacteria bacterium]MDB5740801.1 hypothetical protein [Alphaproteobacteria bacterium]